MKASDRSKKAPPPSPPHPSSVQFLKTKCTKIVLGGFFLQFPVLSFFNQMCWLDYVLQKRTTEVKVKIKRSFNCRALFSSIGVQLVKPDKLHIIITWRIASSPGNYSDTSAFEFVAMMVRFLRKMEVERRICILWF